MITIRKIFVLVLISLIGTFVFGQNENLSKDEQQQNNNTMAEDRVLPTSYFIKLTMEQRGDVHSIIFVAAGSKYSVVTANECITIISIQGCITKTKYNEFLITHSINVKDTYERLANGYSFTSKNIATSSYISLDEEITIVDFGKKKLKIKYLITDDITKIESNPKKKK